MDISCHYLPALKASVHGLARLAFEEDMPTGDITAQSLEMSGHIRTARIICREPISFCGEAWFEQVLDAYKAFRGGCDVQLKCLGKDGQRMEAGSTLFTLKGDAADIVSLERTLLNFLGRAIGIANATWHHVAAVRKHTDVTHILDTRKTLPGYRFFDKYAVLCGGGRNHRMSLSDMVLVKENHLEKLGGVGATLAVIRAHLSEQGAPADFPIQVEVTNMDQLRDAIDAKCPLIMLDNFSPDMVAQALALPTGDSLLEVSGGIHLGNIDTYAQHAPHRISIGAITHSVKAPDLSLLIQDEEE